MTDLATVQRPGDPLAQLLHTYLDGLRSPNTADTYHRTPGRIDTVTTPAQPADLITWLRAQLDDDERLARNAAPGPWEYQDIESVGGGRVCDPTVAIASMHWDTDRVDPRIRRSVRDEEADGTGEHIARHDPARVLRQVERDRRILDEIVDRIDGLEDAADNAYRVQPRAEAEPYVSDALLRLLALPYADRPGYRSEWAP